jgi:hypothetical protein
MLSAEEYLLKADNYAFAATKAATPQLQRAYIRAAAMCRNRALRIKLGARAQLLDRAQPAGWRLNRD